MWRPYRSWRRSGDSFNPGLGFLPTSVAGFPRKNEQEQGFNPGLGFLPTSVRLPRPALPLVINVSIPVWVFSLLRSYERLIGVSRVFDGFNPGLGFLPTSVLYEPWNAENEHSVSIPVWVFSLLRFGNPPSPLSAAASFQSRSGFSPYFGDRNHRVDQRDPQVSIPVWVFSLLR